MAEGGYPTVGHVPFLPDMHDFYEPLPSLSSVFGWGAAPKTAAQSIRVETRFGTNVFIVRAELPGVDPDSDVELTVSEDVLTIHAERPDEKKRAQHSEFCYGTFSRSVRLPADAKPDEITASYDAGILTVTVPLQNHHRNSSRTIAITSGNSAKGTT